MFTTITEENAGVLLHSAVWSAISEIPEASSSIEPDANELRKLADAYDKVWNKLLDCVLLSANIRDNYPLPFVLDPDGSTVDELEKAEMLLRDYTGIYLSRGDHLTEVVKVAEAAIGIFRDLRWEIMINDGTVEKGTGEYNDARSFMASMGL